jgi:hypothetical protein
MNTTSIIHMKEITWWWYWQLMYRAITTLIINSDDNDNSDTISFLVFYDHIYIYRRIYLIRFVDSSWLYACSCFSFLFIHYYKKHQMIMKNKTGNVVGQMAHNEKKKEWLLRELEKKESQMVSFHLNLFIILIIEHWMGHVLYKHILP